MSTCKQLDLQTLGSQPIMPKNFPNHWTKTPTTKMNYYNRTNRLQTKQSLIVDIPWNLNSAVIAYV